MQNKWDIARQALLAGVQSVPMTAYWNALCQDEGFGTRRGRRWDLSSADLRLLRMLITRETGIDPCLSALPQDRMTQARDASDEKLAQEPVFSRLILVAKRDGWISMRDGNQGKTPAGSCLAVPAAQLDLSSETQLIVVENGFAIQQWHQVHIPESWRNALWCYRGHGKNASELLALLKNQPHLQVAWFCDFDPAGLVMAMRDNWFLIVPEFAVSQNPPPNFLQKHNKLPTFLAQQKYGIPKNQDGRRSAIWNYMQSNQIAVTQEAMISNNLAMTLV